ncbi:unnamed protein product [Ectocarpus sp. 12 AP-2014]
MAKGSVGVHLRWSCNLFRRSFVVRPEVSSCCTCASMDARVLPCGLLTHHTPHSASAVQRFAPRITCRLCRLLVGRGRFRWIACRRGLQLSCSQGQNVGAKMVTNVLQA